MNVVLWCVAVHIGGWMTEQNAMHVCSVYTVLEDIPRDVA